MDSDEVLPTVVLIAAVALFASSAFAGSQETRLGGVHIPSRGPAKRHHRKMVAHHGLPKMPARKPGHAKARTHHMPRIVTPEGRILRVAAGKAAVKVTR